MQYLSFSLIVIHIFSSLLWVSSIIVIVYVIHPLWNKYREYTYFWNFRSELLNIIIRLLNYTLVFSIVSGAGLAGLYHRVVLSGNYGIYFSLKMALMVGMFFLAQPYLKMFEVKDISDMAHVEVMKVKQGSIHGRAIAIFVMGIAITSLGILLRKI